MRYKFTDGKALEANTPKEFVRKMNATSYAPCLDDYEFMQDCAERGRKMGLYIKAENAEMFLDSLIQYGIVSIEGSTGILNNN